MNAESLNKRLFAFLSDSPSSFHAVHWIKNALEDHDFIRLEENQKWQLQTGQPYYLVRDDGALIAFNLGTKNQDSIRIIGSHTDSPALQLKPKPDVCKDGYHQLGVEIYGGPLLNPWFDRELSIAGRVTLQDQHSALSARLVDFKRPMAVIPSLAIHLDRKANEEKTLNAQKDIVPIVGLSADEGKTFLHTLKEKIVEDDNSLSASTILGFDLFLYDYHIPCYFGIDNEFIIGSRLDNLLSTFALIEAGSQANRENSFMLVCNNHEEVGSTTVSGARGNMLLSIVERLFPDPEDRYRIFANSFFISVDNAHAFHPNYPEKHESAHKISLNRGPVLKINAQHKYASTGLANGVFKVICQEKDIEVQEFVMRSDMPCGSTIGPLTAAKLGIRTVDIGAAQLAMHSVREMTGSLDPFYLYTVLRHFLQRSDLPEIQASL